MLFLFGLGLSTSGFQTSSKITPELIDQIGKQSFLFIYEDIDRALVLADSTLRLSKSIDYKKGLITAYYNYGSIFLTITDYPKALKSYEESILIAEATQNTEMLPIIYSAMGIALDESGRTKAAIDYHFKALHLSELQNDTLSIADSFNNIGILFVSQNDYNQAISYYLKALKLFEGEKANQPSMATYYSNLGDAYFNVGKKDSAQIFYEYALAIDTKYNDIEGLAYSNLSLGNIYVSYKKYREAFAYIQAALVHATDIGDRAQEVSVLNSMAKLYWKQGELAKSLEVVKNSYRIAKEITFPEGIRDALEIEASIQQDLGNYNVALKKLKQFHQFADSIQNEQKLKLLVHQQAEYDFSKERIAFEIERENRAATQRLTNIGLGLSALIIILILLFSIDKMKNNKLLRNANKQISLLNENLELKIAERTAELVKRNEQLEEYAETNSHKVRHSLAQLLGITDLIDLDIEKHDVDREEEKRLLKMLRKSTEELDTIVKDIDAKISIKK